MTPTPAVGDSTRVADIPGDFPFKSFGGLKEALRTRAFSLGVDPLAAAEWANRFNTLFKKSLVVSFSVLLVVLAASSIVATFVTGNYWLLMAIPIMAIAFYCSHPGSPVQRWATLGGVLSVVVLVNLILTRNHTAAVLVAYAGLTFALVRAAGFINNSSFRRALMSDEAAFVAAYREGKCTLKDNESKRVYSAT